MDNKIDYCEKCNKKVSYSVTREIKEEYRGVKVEVEQNIGLCDECGERLYVVDLEDANLKRLYDRYRELSDIVKPNDIKVFRDRYGISQRELVAILDWGKMTINRYERGSLPNQSHSDILKLIIEDEAYLQKKVEEAYNKARISEKTYSNFFFAMDLDFVNQSNLIRGVIIHKLSKKPSIYNGFNHFDLVKLENLIGYIATKVDNLYKTSLNKYLWYIDFTNYKYYVKSITGLSYARYPFGPIIVGKNYELLLHLEDKYETEIFESYNSEVVKIKSRGNYDLSLFSKEELDTIDNVINLFKGKKVNEISDLSHEEKGWIVTKANDVISYEYAIDLKIV